MLTVSVLSAAHAASRRFRSPRTRFRASPGPPALERPAWRPGPHRALDRAALWAQDESIAPSQTHWGVCPKSPTPRPLTIQTLKVGQVVDERRERAAAPTSPEDAPPGTAATRTSRGAQDRMRMGPADDGGDGGDGGDDEDGDLFSKLKWPGADGGDGDFFPEGGPDDFDTSAGPLRRQASE